MITSNVTGNIVTLSDSGNSPLPWKAPADLDWFFIYWATGPMMAIAIDQEAPIIFPQRTMWMGKFSQLIFSKYTSSTLTAKALITYGRGAPPKYPSLDDQGTGIAWETAATANIAGGAQVLLNSTGLPVRAVWISVPLAAATGVWINSDGGAAAEGIYLAPGTTTRIPIMAPSTQSEGPPYINNVSAGAVQIGIAYEVL